eukprot:104134_1
MTHKEPNITWAIGTITVCNSPTSHGTHFGALVYKEHPTLKAFPSSTIHTIAIVSLQHNYTTASDKYTPSHFGIFLNLSNTHDFKCTSAQNNGDALIVNGDTTNHDKYGYTVPVFAKARVITSHKYQNNAILIQELEYTRHWDAPCTIMNIDIEWDNKLNKAVWRGASSDGWYRRSFVRQYIGNYTGHSDMNHLDDIDVGFTSFTVRSYETIADLRPLFKHPLKIEQLLKYKYLVSIDGNDVATNTKWILMSNSVLFMLPPTKESWLMEGLLEPYVHYVPLSLNRTKNHPHATSFTDETWTWNLEEQYQFCMENDEICNQIAQNGKRFMIEHKFCDRKHERKVEKEILDRYCQQNRLYLNHLQFYTYGRK